MAKRDHVPACHPDKPYWAKGLCRNCYIRSRLDATGRRRKRKPKAFAACHPDRPMMAMGKCTECYLREYHQKHREKQLAGVRRARLKFLYGLTQAEYESMWRSQGGKCAICACDLSSSKVKPMIDHCHSTNIVRGLLCSKCNFGLGCFSDNGDHLQAAIDYLLHWKSMEGSAKVIPFPGRLSRGKYAALKRRTGRSDCEIHREAIASWLSAGRNAKTIWNDLVNGYGFSGGYDSVKRFVRNLRRPAA